jgi:5-methylthioadenosine/S-adenosylhomocysteine deaminase
MRPLLRSFICFAALLSITQGVLGQSTPIALTGTLVMPQDVIENGTVLIQDGRIVASGAAVKIPAGAKTIHTDGVIAPGLIDLHNHLTWNIFPRWKPTEEFGNRYDWQQKPVYNILLTVPHQAIVDAGLECEAERYAEVKAITEGETSLTGSMQQSCNERLDRDLDVAGGAQLGPGLGSIIYNVFPLQMSPQALAEADAALSATPRGSLLIHIAEGGPHDAAAAREFQQLKGRGLLRPGVSLIHAVGIKPEGFVEMAAHGVGFIWSPRSNVELYGDTANVAAAKSAGVTMALAPDWSPTGSDGLLGELNYASVWNQTQKPPLFTERDLVMMATANAAELVNLSPQIGSLSAGHAADLIVVKKPTASHDAYWTLTHSTPADVQLVMIGGVAMYGDAATMQVLASEGERLEVCGAAKTLTLPGKPFAETARVLDHALQQQGRKLAPLAECGQ